MRQFRGFWPTGICSRISKTPDRKSGTREIKISPFELGGERTPPRSNILISPDIMGARGCVASIQEIGKSRLRRIFSIDLKRMIRKSRKYRQIGKLGSLEIEIPNWAICDGHTDTVAKRIIVPGIFGLSASGAHRSGKS